MTFIVDFSFAHASVTKALVERKLGEHCIGGVAYAGCNDTSKNITKAELHALLDAGYQMGLVIENVAADAIGGAPVGTAQGRAVVAAAKELGYDWQNCVLFGGYDTNAVPGDYRHLEDYMEAFAAEVPVPGYYGDSDSIDFMHERAGRDWIFWQSSSGSFSPLNPTPRAHLLQRFADPRANPLGSSVDVNDIARTPLHLMGEDPMPTLDEIGDEVERRLNKHIVTVDGDSNISLDEALSGLRKRSFAQADELDALRIAVAKIGLAVAQLDGATSGVLHVTGDLTVTQ